MQYKFILKEGYRENIFVFDNFEEGCTFMKQALNHGKDFCFVVDAITEDGEVEIDEE